MDHSLEPKESEGLDAGGVGSAAGAYPDVEARTTAPKAVFPAAVFSVKALILGQDRGQGLDLPVH